MKVKRAYKFRLYPTQEQEQKLGKTFGCCRFLWNKMLAERKVTYEKLKDKKEEVYTYTYKTEKAYKQQYPFLKEVGSKALQTETRNLRNAFKEFFKGTRGYPKFKSKKYLRQSFTTYNVNNNVKIDFKRKRIKIPKVKTWFTYRDDRVFHEPIKTITLSKTKSGKYFISLIVEKKIDIHPKKVLQEHKIIAFDMSLTHVLVSERIKLTSPRFCREEEQKLKSLHRWVSWKKKGSKNREKAKKRLARFYDRFNNRRKDWMHNMTTKLTELYDAIILEDLNIKGMQQFTKGVSKSVTLDFSWSEFVRLLEYKLEERGKYLIQVDRYFPSSKQCSTCGYKYDDLCLSEREWTCPTCGKHHDRDVNASRNLYSEGCRILTESGVSIQRTVGTTGTIDDACGEDIRPHFEAPSMKQETICL